GTVTFDVCANSTCTAGGDPFSTFSSSAGVANGSNGSANVPGGAGLADGTTYYWRATNTDNYSTSSAASAIQSFTVDTTKPTTSSATVAADGKTVTVTWSENLDTAQTLANSSFTVTPNGGSAISGTAANVTYPAANQTQFVLASAVHHLDSLSLAYTVPGSGGTIRDLAWPAGNQALGAS